MLKVSCTRELTRTKAQHKPCLSKLIAIIEVAAHIGYSGVLACDT